MIVCLLISFPHSPLPPLPPPPIIWAANIIIVTIEATKVPLSSITQTCMNGQWELPVSTLYITVLDKLHLFRMA